MKMHLLSGSAIPEPVINKCRLASEKANEARRFSAWRDAQLIALRDEPKTSHLLKRFPNKANVPATSKQQLLAEPEEVE
jgi:hypothetical protein